MKIPFIALLSSMIFACSVVGQPGSLDPSFGTNGQTFVSSETPPVKLLIQSDGKVVSYSRGISLSGSGYRVIRLNADGSLDAGFGANGTASNVWNLVKGNTTYYGSPNTIAIQKVAGQDRVLVLGGAPLLVGNKVVTDRLRIDRLMPDGSLDTSWGTNGRLQLNVEATVNATVQSDQKIVYVRGNPDSGIIRRLNANGSIDTTFGINGVVSNGRPYTNVQVDSLDRIITDGLTTVGNGKNARYIIAIRRFLQDGSIDTSFGTGGSADTFTPARFDHKLVADTEGRVLLVGTRSLDGGPERDIAVVRLTAGGHFDTTFSGDGLLVIDFLGGEDVGKGIAIQADGRILIGGYTRPASSVPSDIGRAKLRRLSRGSMGHRRRYPFARGY